MQIIKLNDSDLENLQKISISTFKETFEEVNSEEDMRKYISESLSLDQLQSELSNTNSEFYFAKNDNEILGYLKLNSLDAQTENQGNDALEIERIYVLKEFFPLKIGQKIIEKSIEIAKSKKMNFN